MAQNHEQETGGTGPGHRSISMGRSGSGTYLVTNARGGTISIGSGESDDFTPVELLLTAIAGCTSLDVEAITSKRTEATRFDVRMTGDKIRDELGNRMTNLVLTLDVEFPDDEEGAVATERLPKALAQSHDRLCSVGRTVQIGTPIDAGLT